MGVVLQELVAVLGRDVHAVEVDVQGLRAADLPLVDLQEELEEFPRGEELGHRGRGEHVAHVLRLELPPGAVVPDEVEAAAVGANVPVDAVEQRGLARAVAAQQAVDLPAFKGEARVPQNLLLFIALFQVFDDELHFLLLFRWNISCAKAIIRFPDRTRQENSA